MMTVCVSFVDGNRWTLVVPLMMTLHEMQLAAMPANITAIEIVRVEL